MNSPAVTERRINDDTMMLVASRTIETSNAHEVFVAITSARKQGFKYVVVDMSALDFISSAGVGALLGTVELLRADGGDLILANIPKPIHSVLEVLDLAEFFTTASSTEDAMAITRS